LNRFKERRRTMKKGEEEGRGGRRGKGRKTTSEMDRR
jgi:hypothetical protein